MVVARDGEEGTGWGVHGQDEGRGEDGWWVMTTEKGRTQKWRGTRKNGEVWEEDQEEEELWFGRRRHGRTRGSVWK